MPIRVIPSRGDKNPMFEFVGRSQLEVMSYNVAVQEVMAGYNDQRREAGLPRQMVFHQVGVTPDSDREPGYHAWEIWGSKPQELEPLVPQIEDAARAHREQSRQWYSSDKEYWAELTEQPELDRYEAELLEKIEADCQRLCAEHGQSTPTNDQAPEQQPER